MLLFDIVAKIGTAVSIWTEAEPTVANDADQWNWTMIEDVGELDRLFSWWLLDVWVWTGNCQLMKNSQHKKYDWNAIGDKIYLDNYLDGVSNLFRQQNMVT